MAAKAKKAAGGLGDAGLLLLRVGVGASLFVKHGLEKITHFPQMRSHFPDPIHVGPTVGLIVALLSDSICSILVAIGFYTRVAAAIIVINLLVVFFFMHKFSFMQEHAELVYIYLVVHIYILIAGGGRFTADNKFR
jgi:putative oxidoreductase